jgi:uncharacterized protein YfiM (DUF2279 family)
LGELARAVLVLAALGSTPDAAVPVAAQPLEEAAAPAVLQLPGNDPWLGSDKFRHSWMSYAATAFTFAGARAANVDRDSGLWLAVSVAGAVGLAKEVHDRRTGGSFSVRDLVADAVGIMAAYMILREVR